MRKFLSFLVSRVLQNSIVHQALTLVRTNNTSKVVDDDPDWETGEQGEGPFAT